MSIVIITGGSRGLFRPMVDVDENAFDGLYRIHLKGAVLPYLDAAPADGGRRPMPARPRSAASASRTMSAA